MTATDLAALRMAYLATGDESARLVYADALEESGDTINTSLLHKGPCHWIGEFEKGAIHALDGLRYAPATFDKNFVRYMTARIVNGQQWLSQKQWESLWRIVYRYRGQLLTGQKMKANHEFVRFATLQRSHV